MSNELTQVGLASMIVELFYVTLRELSFEDKEDTEEFRSIVLKLRSIIPNENKIYSELSNEDIVFALNSFIKTETDNLVKQRIYSRIKDLYRKRTNTTTVTELGNIISTKILIDVLKELNRKLYGLIDSNLETEEQERLLSYANVYKYNYLTANPFIEDLALKANFNIEALPDIKFDEVEKSFQLKFVEKSTELFLSYVKDSIKELISAESRDEYLNVHVTLFEISRVEVMLPYLTKSNLEDLSHFIETLEYKNKDVAIRNIKKLIKKRKEELE